MKNLKPPETRKVLERKKDSKYSKLLFLILVTIKRLGNASNSKNKNLIDVKRERELATRQHNNAISASHIYSQSPNLIKTAVY